MFRKNKTVSYKGHIATIKSQYPAGRRYLIEFKNPYYGWPEEKIGPGRYYFVNGDDIIAYKPTNYDRPNYVQKIYDKYTELKDMKRTLYDVYKRPGPTKKKIWNNLTDLYKDKLIIMSYNQNFFTCAMSHTVVMSDNYTGKDESEEVFTYISRKGLYEYIVRDGKIVCRI